MSDETRENDEGTAPAPPPDDSTPFEAPPMDDVTKGADPPGVERRDGDS
jgi:hypothetical protein